MIASSSEECRLTKPLVSITVGIPFKHVDTALVESAASIVKRYIAQADRESGRGVSPNLQVYMSQIPIDILRTLSYIHVSKLRYVMV